MNLVPVDTLPLEDMIYQLSRGPYPEWCLFKGQHIGDVEVGILMYTDPDWMVFWMTRLWESERAFQRIVDSKPVGRTGWARRQLKRAQEHVAYYTTDVE